MVMVKRAGQKAPEVVLAQHDDVIQVLPPDAPDLPLRIRTLPGTPGGSEHLFHAQARHAPLDPITMHGIAVSERVLGCGLPGKGFDELLRRTLGGRKLGHIEVDYSPSVVGQAPRSVR